MIKEKSLATKAACLPAHGVGNVHKGKKKSFPVINGRLRFINYVVRIGQR